MTFVRMILIAVLTLTLSAITSEFALRKFSPSCCDTIIWTGSQTYLPDPQLIYSRIPNKTWVRQTSEFTEHVASNSLGYRDREFTASHSGTYRIFAVGDSFTFGHGIPESSQTYPKQLEQLLNGETALQKRIEVLNVAEKGYSPDQEYREITTRLLSYAPDMILWNFSIPGDIDNLIHDPGWPVPSLYDVRNGKLVALDARWNWLYISNRIRIAIPPINKSYLFNWVVRRLSTIAFFSRKTVLPPDAAVNIALHKMLLETESVQKLAAAHNARLVIVIVPYPNVYTDTYQKSALPGKIDAFARALNQKGVPVIRVDRRIADLSRQSDVAMSQKNDVLGEQHVNIPSLYYKEDYHPNIQGALLIAREVETDLMGIMQKP